MRHLIIMRHAKAERGENKTDFERELEPRGIVDAGTVAARLAARSLVPDTVLCSAARRTRDTFAAMLPHFGADAVVHLRRSLYDADTVDLRDAVRSAQGQTILVVGHNPSVHALALAFAGDRPEAAPLMAGFPTASAAVFTMGFAIDTVRFQELLAP